MRRMTVISTILLLASCADWPDVDAPRPSRAVVDWPELIPLSDLPTAGGTREEDDANRALMARAEALRARAALLRRPVPDSAAFERLRARLAR